MTYFGSLFLKTHISYYIFLTCIALGFSDFTGTSTVSKRMVIYNNDGNQFILSN